MNIQIEDKAKNSFDHYNNDNDCQFIILVFNAMASDSPSATNLREMRNKKYSMNYNKLARPRRWSKSDHSKQAPMINSMIFFSLLLLLLFFFVRFLACMAAAADTHSIIP